MATHPLPRREFTHAADLQPRAPIFARWERHRHREAHWFVECVAEALGVFLYVFGGVGSVAPYVLGNLLGTPGLGSLLQIGFGFAIGITLAIILCAPTSGGHFNPGLTITLVILKKFPKRKAVRYIIAQIMGSYIACLLIYVQYHHMIKQAEATLVSQGKLASTLFTPQGPAGIFALYVGPGANLGQVFVSEFICDFVIGVVVWACLDPTNFTAPPAAGPWIISFTYAMCIWGFVPVGLSTNTARDLGARFMTMTIWGRGASGGAYAAIAALANIPATFSAALFYEFILTDSSRVVTPGHVDFIAGHLAHAEHKESVVTGQDRPSMRSSYEEKGDIQTIERVEKV